MTRLRGDRQIEMAEGVVVLTVVEERGRQVALEVGRQRVEIHRAGEARDGLVQLAPPSLNRPDPGVQIAVGGCTALCQFQLAQRLVVLRAGIVIGAHRGMPHRETWLKPEGSLGRPPGQVKERFVTVVAEQMSQGVPDRKPGVRQRKAGVESHRSLERLNDLRIRRSPNPVGGGIPR